MAVVVSLLPDADTLLPGLVHRGVTHTLFAAVVAGVAVVLLCHLSRTVAPGLGPERAGIYGLVGTAAVVSHLLGDVITPMGIRPLFPLWEAHHTFDIVRASSPAANTLLLLAGGAAVTLSYSVQVRLPRSDGEESSLPVPPSIRR